jgi:hypothetical protein
LKKGTESGDPQSKGDASTGHQESIKSFWRYGRPASICIKDMISRFVIETFRAFGPPFEWPLLSYEVVAEASRNFGDPIFRGRNVRYGDGKPVLLVPGQLAGDATLFPLAMWLRAIGYQSSQAALPINLDDRLLDNSLAAALREAACRVERKAAIIAFGTGARVALRVAALEHAHVSDVIALGLPDCLPVVPEGVRVHVIGRLLLRRAFAARFILWRAQTPSCLPTPKRSTGSPRFCARFPFPYLRKAGTTVRVPRTRAIECSINRRTWN